MIALSVNVKIMMIFIAATFYISRLEICKPLISCGLFQWEAFMESIVRIVEIRVSVGSVRGKSEIFHRLFNTDNSEAPNDLMWSSVQVISCEVLLDLQNTDT
jgi:hypothetical protein